MVQTFEIDIAASVCPPLTEQEIQDAIVRAVLEKERSHGMGAIRIEVKQTFGTFAMGTAEYGQLK
jgi:hypothetical protein